MRKLANVGHLGVKELRSLSRDPVLLVLIVWTFSLSVYSEATGMSQELHNAPIAIVDEDRSPLSERIGNAFYPPYFSTPKRIPLSDIDPSMDAGIYTFVLDIPPNFERDLLAGRKPVIQVNVDATMMGQAFTGAGYIENIISGEIGEFVKGYRSNLASEVELTTRYKFNPTLTSTWFGGVMAIINNITMLSVILTGAALIREREHGTLEHLMVMPLTAGQIMLSKIWAMGLVVLVAAALSLRFVVQGALSMPIAGSLGLFLLGASLHLFSTTSMGIFLGTVSRSMPQLGLLMILIILPLQMLSGGTTPFESMPEPIQLLMLGAPTAHFVSTAQALLFRGAGFATVWPSFVAIIAIGAVYFLLALALFRKSLSATQ